MTQKIKITDIAQASGVSIATVSLVLNNRPGISQDTRTRVLDICEELGYQLSNSMARAGRLETLGMIVKAESDVLPQANPFYSQVMAGIEQACRRGGINLLYATLPVDENNHPTQIPVLFGNKNLDGLLMVGAFWDELIQTVSDQKSPPIVLVDGYSNTESFDMVVSDNFRASYQMVEYLLAKGHRHIALAGGEADAYPSLRDRRNGYLRALKEHDINDIYLCEFNINKTKGHSEIAEFLKSTPQVTAIFGINDQVALDVSRVAQMMGKHIPGELSIVGYDDTYLAVNAHPPLTTIRVDTVAMGRAAVQMLAFRIENPEAARMTLTIHPTLVERYSVTQL
ncbi:MAG: hypothetical protein CVU39_16640 [Chloroflexi bacterium HGW-Chloroflexi-10]|nr:MAG: hypothetical protein CVU39_16640 [Chloroflexi bacterium HGW-Chloroflexi-10]